MWGDVGRILYLGKGRFSRGPRGRDADFDDGSTSAYHQPVRANLKEMAADER